MRVRKWVRDGRQVDRYVCAVQRPPAQLDVEEIPLDILDARRRSAAHVHDSHLVCLQKLLDEISTDVAIATSDDDLHGA